MQYFVRADGKKGITAASDQARTYCIPRTFSSTHKRASLGRSACLTKVQCTRPGAAGELLEL